MVNYANCKVYRLVARDRRMSSESYVGSTCQPLSKRMVCHRGHARKGHPSNVYRWMRDIGIENVEIILLENCPCSNFEEQRQHERRWKDSLQPSLNMLNPYVSIEERAEQKRQYYTDNTTQILEQQRQYRRANVEKFREKKRQYRQANAEQILEKKRQYNVEHAEQIREYNQQFYEANRDAIRKRQRQHYAAMKAAKCQATA